jgi:acetyl esterase/lipase
VLQGDTDMQVTPEQADSIAATLRAAGNRQVTLQHFPATNHLFVADPSGSPAAYARLTDLHLRKSVLGAIADWMSRVAKE